MSIDCVNRVLFLAPLDKTHLLALVALANFADEDDIAFPSTETMAFFARVKHRWAREILDELKRSGCLYIKPGGKGRGNRTEYLITIGLSQAQIQTRLTRRFKLKAADAKTLAVELVNRQRAKAAEYFGAWQPETIPGFVRQKMTMYQVLIFPEEMEAEQPTRREKRYGKPYRQKGELETPQRELGGLEPPQSLEGPKNPQKDDVRGVPSASFGGSVESVWGVSDAHLGGLQRKNEMPSSASGTGKPRTDPIMNHDHDPSHDPPTPTDFQQQFDFSGGGGGPFPTTLYLQEHTDINIAVTEELGDLPLDRVKELVERKRRAGSKDGGIVNALRAFKRRLALEAQEAAARSSTGQPSDIVESVDVLEARARAIAPADADEIEMQWLMVFLEEGASDDDALRMLAERRERQEREVNEDGKR